MSNSKANKPKILLFELFLVIFMAFNITLLTSISQRSFGHEISPAIAEILVKEDVVEIDIYYSVEIFLANIDASSVKNTNETSKSDIYDAYRLLDSEDIAKQFQSMSSSFIKLITIKSQQKSIEPEFVSIEISESSNITYPRESKIKLIAPIREDDKHIIFGWNKRLGPMIIRQVSDSLESSRIGTEPELYSAYLSSGELSSPIIIEGITSVSSLKIIRDYLIIGFEHIIPKGLDHILFVLGLFLFASRFSQLVVQVSLFTVAHTITLALASIGLVNIPSNIVEPLIALSISYVALETLWHTRMGWSRLIIIFAFGLLHGLGFASVLMEIGLNQRHFIIGLVAFNVGVEIGQLVVICAAYLFIGILFFKTRFYRSFVQIPLSLVIGAIGGWWFIERIFF